MSNSGEIPNNIQMDRKKFQKMVFITNALDNGWIVKKSHDSYIYPFLLPFVYTVNFIFHLLTIYCDNVTLSYL